MAVTFLPQVKFILDASDEVLEALASGQGLGGDITGSGTDLTAVPPSFLKELKIEQSIGGLLKLEARFSDASFQFIENALINPNRLQRNTVLDRIAVQWGYYEEGSISPVYRFAMLRAIPSFGEGVEWQFDGIAVGSELNFSKDFQSDPSKIEFENMKVSDIVFLLGRAMGLSDENMVVEPTVDDILITSSLGLADPMTYIQERLCNRALNATAREGGYVAYWSDDIGGRTVGGALHFHTPDYIQPADPNNLPTFTYLKGAQDSNVLQFSPEFPSGSIGSVFARGVKASGSDGTGKEGVVVPVNDSTQERLVKLSVSSQYPSAGNEQAASSQTGVRCGLWYKDSASIEAHTKWLWSFLTKQAISAGLEIAGRPQDVGLRAGQLVQLLVNNPVPNQPGLHWSSGIWRIWSIEHIINTGDIYRISMKLKRDSHLTGIYTFEQIPSSPLQASQVAVIPGFNLDLS